MRDGGPSRTCTECPNPVSARALTCSASCRSARSRRLRSASQSGSDLAALTEADGGEVTREVLREELRPVIRESLTEDVLDGIQDLIEHIPSAITAAKAGLEAVDREGNPDFVERRQAAALILRHSIGNTNIVPDINEGTQQQMNVVFGIPRPPEASSSPEDETTGVIETKPCDSCGIDKPLTAFVGASDRCQECFDRMRESAKALVGEEAVEQDTGIELPDGTRMA